MPHLGIIDHGLKPIIFYSKQYSINHAHYHLKCSQYTKYKNIILGMNKAQFLSNRFSSGNNILTCEYFKCKQTKRWWMHAWFFFLCKGKYLIVFESFKLFCFSTFWNLGCYMGSVCFTEQRSGRVVEVVHDEHGRGKARPTRLPRFLKWAEVSQM